MSTALDRVTRAKEELERFKREAMEAGAMVERACADCRHFNRSAYAYCDESEAYVYGLCEHPAILTATPDFKDGKLKYEGRQHYEFTRSSVGLCGPEGALHDPPEPRVSIWQRLFGK
jgi:hypothetical protein